METASIKSLSEKIADLGKGEFNRVPLARRAESVISGRQEGRVKDHEVFPIASVYMLDFWWKVFEERSLDVSAMTAEPLPEGVDAFDEIFRRILRFGTEALDEVDFSLRAEKALNPDRQIFDVVSKAERISMQQGTMIGKRPDQCSMKDKIRTNMSIGISHDLALIEVVEKVFRRQFGRGIWKEEYERIISSREFENILAAIGADGRIQVIPLVGLLEADKRNIGVDNLLRSTYDPDSFYFEQDPKMGGGRILQVFEETWVKIEQQVADMIKMVKSGTITFEPGFLEPTGCPLHAVRANEGANAFRVYSRVVRDVVKQLYLEKFEKREELPSSGQVFHMGPSST
ncbi:MAG: hypothetical protein AAB373_04000 [Patescibacteria group bacterium]